MNQNTIMSRPHLIRLTGYSDLRRLFDAIARSVPQCANIKLWAKLVDGGLSEAAHRRG
jgi:hypothetical protein